MGYFNALSLFPNIKEDNLEYTYVDYLIMILLLTRVRIACTSIVYKALNTTKFNNNNNMV